MEPTTIPPWDEEDFQERKRQAREEHESWLEILEDDRRGEE